MADQEPMRPGQAVLDDRIEEAIATVSHEWDLTTYEVVGVLHVMAARYAHRSIQHEE